MCWVSIRILWNLFRRGRGLSVLLNNLAYSLIVPDAKADSRYRRYSGIFSGIGNNL